MGYNAVSHHAISIATIVGLVIVLCQLWYSADSGLAHLRNLLLATAAFYSARSAHWLLEADITRTLTIITASILPLLVLLVAEQFMRRHAPFWIKAFITTSTGLLMLGTLFSSLNVTIVFVGALMIFQLTAISIILWFIHRRDKNSLSTEENHTLNRISLILLIVLPLLVSDYDVILATVNLSGLGVLCGCWILVHMHERVFGRIRMGLELAILVAFSLVTSLFVAWHLEISNTQWLPVWAMLAAFTMAAATFVSVLHLRWRDGPLGGITQGLLQADSFQSYLVNLRERGPGCIILTPADLTGYEHALLVDAFDADGSYNSRELPSEPDDDNMSQSQIRHLLLSHGADRAFLVARQPLHIAVAQRRGLAAGPDTELSAAFSLARLLAERENLRSAQ